MNKLLLSALVLASLVASGAAKACPVLAEPEQIARHNADRVELGEMVTRAAGAADLIFVGRVISVGDSGENEGVVRRPTQFEVISIVKGSKSDAMDLHWDEPIMTVNVRCSEADFFEHIDLTETYRYLIYVQGRKIVRARPMLDWPPPLSAEEELQILGASK